MNLRSIFKIKSPKNQSEADLLRAEAARVQPGPERDRLLKLARKADVQAHLYDWATSPGLKSPERPL